MTTPPDNSPPSGMASDPQLIMLWTAPLDLTGKGMKAGGSESKMPPESLPFAVNLATVQAAQQSMLTAGLTVVTTYNPLVQQVQQAISEGTIFGQQATYNTLNQPAKGPAHPEYHVPDTELQSSAQEYAAKANPAMTRVLRALADGMATAGTFIAMMNNSGQLYTAADQNSAVPPAPAPGGGPKKSS
jgi:hypothetical protein